MQGDRTAGGRRFGSETPVVCSRHVMLGVPEEHVRITGIYDALHFGHRPPHEVFLWQHEIFPRCRQCESNVIFKLVRGTIQPTRDHVSADEDFAGGVSAA
jgi:hypothetical protein